MSCLRKLIVRLLAVPAEDSSQSRAGLVQLRETHGGYGLLRKAMEAELQHIYNIRSSCTGEGLPCE
jgi:hypothetical protein